jgi:hypothetical protein|tara:strand:+ start:3943 stop:4188 length:246 start_codon:yes stop_codon:yes gene_type:complete
MSGVADRLSKFLENAFSKAFSRDDNEESLDVQSDKDMSFMYESIEEYKDAGYHFRRTKDQMSRGLTREEAFKEFKKGKKNA